MQHVCIPSLSSLCFPPLTSFRIKLLPARPALISLFCAPQDGSGKFLAPATNPPAPGHAHLSAPLYPLRTSFRVQSPDADSAFSLNHNQIRADKTMKEMSFSNFFLGRWCCGWCFRQIDFFFLFFFFF